MTFTLSDENADFHDRALEIEQRYTQLDCIRWRDYQRFIDRGVPSRALVYPELPKRARVVFYDAAPFFDFADEVDEEAATSAGFVLLARNEFGEPADLVAWNPSTGRVAPYLGNVSMLGLDQLWQPRLMHEGALPVCETPLEWLRAERRAVVILDPARARWSLFRTNLIVSDVAFGCRVREALRWPAPQIFVEGQMRNAA